MSKPQDKVTKIKSLFHVHRYHEDVGYEDHCRYVTIYRCRCGAEKEIVDYLFDCTEGAE